VNLLLNIQTTITAGGSNPIFNGGSATPAEPSGNVIFEGDQSGIVQLEGDQSGNLQFE